ncbi:sensor histidine kinase [Archangium violaceum]|uniref:sensor histidine kinase n=1 Tax=Archangium violaceum TaxID=83451 RepID=UPI001EF44E9D|nr:ATP-binding protein [Archangium violaceum]
MIARLVANEPHARCRIGEGTLAPLAAALNRLATQLERRGTDTSELFGVRALVEQSPNMMLACDTDSNIRFFNYTTPGSSPSETIGHSIYEYIRADDAERVRGIIQRVLETGEPTGYEAQSVPSSGTEWFLCRVGPIRNGGQIIGFTMIMTDISQLKRVQQRLEQSNRELESFASVASHDLQEPLRKIQTFGERLKTTTSATLGPEGSDYLERMMNAATRMRRLIEDLLSFSRVGSKGNPFVQTDLGRIAREVLEDLETAVERSGATVTLGELPTLEADPLQLRQLLQNLLSNALKFRREDVAPAISARGTIHEASGELELVVEDNGIGFDEKYLDRIFEVFQRLHGRGKYEGTGIGLAICRKIAERHGGHIGARSSPGHGATFIVTLPLRQSNPR